ncbi:hypothetical protein [Vagococcus fluvialis]|uniref:hypothetical protein n=1 Tax=Vagococcus fluvialis TaxID=2738 RepID=UPI003B21300F
MKQKIIYLLITILTILSVFFPTSKNGIIMSSYTTGVGIACFLLLFILFVMLNNGRINKRIAISGSIIFLSLILSTLTSPYHDIKIGMSVFYASFVMVTFIDFSKITGVNYIRLFQFLSIPIFTFSILTIRYNLNFKLFLLKNYSAYYDALVSNMFSVGKPVTFFASHSIAGLVYFIFFYISFQHFKANKKIIPLIICIGYLVLLYNLKSVTSLSLLLVSIVYLVYNTVKTVKGYIIFSFVLLFIVIFNYNYLAEKVQMFSLMLNNSYLSSINGFAGRYSDGTGALNSNMEYIKNNLFRPLGFTSAPEVQFIDSGMIEYMLRGGLVLVISMYYSLYKFLTINISHKKQAIFLFLVFIAFETGFAGLITPRIVYLIPLIVITLNSIKTNENKSLAN